MQERACITLFGCGLFALLSLHSLNATDMADKISFSTKDSCSASGCVMEFLVKAKGAVAYVEAKYVSHAEHTGKTDGTTEYMLLDFNNLTIKNLFPKSKTYTMQTCSEIRKIPIYQMIQELRAKESKDFQASTSYHGTLYEAKTVTTTLEKAEKKASFKDTEVSVPAGFKRLDESSGKTNNLLANQPEAQGSSSPGINTPRTGNSNMGTPVGLPGIGP